MSVDHVQDLGEARRWFAEELRHTAHVHSAAVFEAFGTVPANVSLGPVRGVFSVPRARLAIGPPMTRIPSISATTYWSPSMRHAASITGNRVYGPTFLTSFP
jgi:hypothetical protein